MGGGGDGGGNAGGGIVGGGGEGGGGRKKMQEWVAASAWVAVESKLSASGTMQPKTRGRQPASTEASESKLRAVESMQPLRGNTHPFGVFCVARES